jgi:formylglycine-generating enzyme required for sulfatase activity
MGSPNDEPGRYDNEGPLRVVTITKPYYMGVFEVTQEQYDMVMGDQQRIYQVLFASRINRFRAPDKPVCIAEYNQVADFCRRLSQLTGKAIRLPTEAEWEHAARAGSRTRYSFGDDEKQLSDYGWYGANSGRSLQPVGLKKPNAWGLYDMHGNVWEMCNDFYGGSFVDAADTDPQGPSAGAYRVLRGGSWSFPARGNRSAVRTMRSPNDLAESGIVGFRVVFTDD